MRALESFQLYIGEFQIEAAIPSECGFIDEFLIKSINLNDIGLPKNYLFLLFLIISQKNFHIALVFQNLFVTLQSQMQKRLISSTE